MAWVEAFMQERKCILDVAQQQWTKHVIIAIWNTVEVFWTHRNQELHAKEHLAQQIRDSTLDAQIRHMYDQRDAFDAADLEISHVPWRNS